MAFVCGEISSRTFSGSIQYVFSSMSARTGEAPHILTDVAEAMKVKEGTMTSSPGPIPSAAIAT